MTTNQNITPELLAAMAALLQQAAPQAKAEAKPAKRTRAENQAIYAKAQECAKAGDWAGAIATCEAAGWPDQAEAMRKRQAKALERKAEREAEAKRKAEAKAAQAEAPQVPASSDLLALLQGILLAQAPQAQAEAEAVAEELELEFADEAERESEAQDLGALIATVTAMLQAPQAPQAPAKAKPAGRPAKDRCATHNVFKRGDGTCSRCEAEASTAKAPQAPQAPQATAKVNLFPTMAENDLRLHWTALAVGGHLTQVQHGVKLAEANSAKAKADGDSAEARTWSERARDLRKAVAFAKAMAEAPQA